MSNVSYYTAEGLKKLRDELQHLKDVERVKASKAIAEALKSNVSRLEIWLNAVVH